MVWSGGAARGAVRSTAWPGTAPRVQLSGMETMSDGDGARIRLTRCKTFQPSTATAIMAAAPITRGE